jgi:signal transduction histidine kinase
MMPSTRRDFMKSVGVAIASLVMTRCIPFDTKSDSASDRVRECWLKLDWLAQRANGDYERGEEARDELAQDHRAALDDLVAQGEIDANVAEELNVAFNAAITHVFLSNAPITCYEPVLVDFAPISSDQLTQQADLLNEFAQSGGIDAETLAQAQDAIERDITFLNLTYEETQALYDELIANAGETVDIPPFNEIELEIPPEVIQAAHFLVDLLLEVE